jgi:DNA-binding response OmpR family regulator
MKQIWIIDDDEEMSIAVQLMLSMLNYGTRIFLDARSAAKELLAGEQPDLIILDVNMPEVSGLDFLEFMRRRNDFKGIPIVMLSTEAAEVLVDKTLWMGADAYVTKPVAVNELDEAVQKAFLAHGVNL